MKKFLFLLCLANIMLAPTLMAQSKSHPGTLSKLFEGLPVKKISKTIVINKAGTYDFKGVVHEWVGSGTCNTKENQPQMLRVEADNVVVKNFYWKGKSGDPVHVTTCGTGQGNKCSRKGPRNVTLINFRGHACEDAMTIGSPGASNITLQDSIIYANPNKSYWDKSVQINFGTNINFINNKFVGGERCIRYKPQTSGLVQGNSFFDCRAPVQGSSKDADISPMKNGTTTISIKKNYAKNCNQMVKKKDSGVKVKDLGGNSANCSIQ